MKLALLQELSAVDDERTVARGLMTRLHLDLPLLLGILTVAVLGLTVLYSASHMNPQLVVRQCIHVLLGLIVMFVLAQIPPHLMRSWALWLYLFGTLLLVAVLLIGSVGKGAQRWLDLGVIRFQPSELMRLAVPMMMATYFSNKPLPPRFKHMVIAVLITGTPFLLIVKQPDLGTALLIAMSGIFVLFLAGLSWFIIIGLGVVAATGAPMFWTFIMHDYQRQRVLTFLNPESDPLGTGWNIIQSKIAIGSGGLYGKGWLNSTQSRLDFLPESSTDFIVGVFAEEFGLVGLCLLLLVYLFIIARGLYIAGQATDAFSRLLAGSLALIFFVYVFVNVGMVSGILPVVGLPLPLVSYGGTALVTIMAGFGILMSIATHRKQDSR
ncbi:MAG: rod shape-determining protein RodA [Gammaproteobacteria bacterium]